MWKRKYLLCLEIFVLCAIGLAMVYSSSYLWAQYKFNDVAFYVKRQFVFMIVGFVVMYFFSKINLLKLRRYNKILFIIGIFLLIAVLIPGLGVERNGSRSWFALASFQFQPSELFKIILIFCVSDDLAKKRKIAHLKDIVKPLLMTFLGFLLLLMQPDFGSGMVMVCSIIVILFCARLPLRYFIYVAFLGFVGLSGLIISAPYRMERILSFLDPWSDPLGSGFQIIQSLYALGPAGLFGGGLNGSIQKHFYLPEPQTDFIFAIFGEEMGFLGCGLLLLLYLLIIYEGIMIALETNDTYLSYVSIGLISLFAIQVMINLGVVVGLFPVTGITLPLLSYGGSSIIVMLSCFGILISNTKH